MRSSLHMGAFLSYQDALPQLQVGMLLFGSRPRTREVFLAML